MENCIKILSKSYMEKKDLPLAMQFAVEPAFLTVPSEVLLAELDYNPVLQINNQSTTNHILAGQTSTSVRRSTTTYKYNPIWGTEDDDDSAGDESK